MEMMHIKKENFEQEVLQAQGKVLVDFWASWCGPCKMLMPVVEQFAKENDKIKVVKINVDEEEELAQRYQVMTIPTLVVIENGKEVKRSVGVISKNAIAELVK
ncbi:MAG: thioredoxin [Lachnospiraceae bacterium]|nr:thioredoxin [Lachnospiraceae bacterium]